MDRDELLEAYIDSRDAMAAIYFRDRLLGGSSADPESIISPCGRILRPFIFRDHTALPPYLKLMLELKYQVTGEIPFRSSIDFCYIRPEHISAVNCLLQKMFWPGIDVSESLQIPEFSVIALYRKLIIGCAFLIPDVDHEAYISFIAVLPQWQRGGIASFMLYHLIQTCQGKDITVHVSAANPALCLYRKFGFRIERLVLDFYDKYVECPKERHALFLRLKSYS